MRSPYSLQSISIFTSCVQVFLDFVDEPLDSVRRLREGIYASYTYGSGDRVVKVVLLDVRSHDVKGSDCDVLGKLLPCSLR